MGKKEEEISLTFVGAETAIVGLTDQEALVIGDDLAETYNIDIVTTKASPNGEVTDLDFSGILIYFLTM